MTLTYEQALGLVGAVVPNHLAAEVAVPILTGVQAQGDLLVIPIEPADPGESVNRGPGGRCRLRVFS